MRHTTEPPARELPLILGARRLLAGGRLGAELVRLAEAAAEMDRERAATLAEADAPRVATRGAAGGGARR